MSAWIKPAEAKYGGSLMTPQAATRDATATTAVAPRPVPSLSGVVSPSQPMFWFAAIAGLGVVLMGYSTYVPE